MLTAPSEWTIEYSMAVQEKRWSLVEFFSEKSPQPLRPQRMLNLSVRVDGQEVQAACPQALWFTDLYRATLLTGTYLRGGAGRWRRARTLVHTNT